VLQFHSIILRYWTSLTHNGTKIIFMLLLKRWKSKFTTLSREMLCYCLNSQACLMQRNSSVSPFVIFNHRLAPRKFGLWNSNLYNVRAGIRNQSFCYAMLCCLSWCVCSKYSIALGNKVIRSDCRVYGFLWHKGKVQVSRRKFGPGLDFKYDISLNTNHK